jgi:hypothetical protein
MLTLSGRHTCLNKIIFTLSYEYLRPLYVNWWQSWFTKYEYYCNQNDLRIMVFTGSNFYLNDHSAQLMTHHRMYRDKPGWQNSGCCHYKVQMSVDKIHSTSASHKLSRIICLYNANAFYLVCLKYKINPDKHSKSKQLIRFRHH